MPRHIVDADAQLRQSLRNRAAFLDLFFEPGLQFFVITAGYSRRC
jgi:hypothetical protein